MQRLGGNWHAIAVLMPAAWAVIATVIVARFLWILPAPYIPRALIPSLRRRDPYPPLSVPIIMSWAGMRGVVSLAAALALPEQFPGRDFILATTFAVILVTVLVFGWSENREREIPANEIALLERARLGLGRPA